MLTPSQKEGFGKEIIAMPLPLIPYLQLVGRSERSQARQCRDKRCPLVPAWEILPSVHRFVAGVPSGPRCIAPLRLSNDRRAWLAVQQLSPNFFGVPRVQLSKSVRWKVPIHLDFRCLQKNTSAKLDPQARDAGTCCARTSQPTFLNLPCAARGIQNLAAIARALLLNTRAQPSRMNYKKSPQAQPPIRC